VSDHSSYKQAKDGLKDQVKAQAKADKEELKQLIKNLSPEQRDQLLRKLATVAHDTAAELMAQSRALDAEVPLSFAQEREWFRDRMFPGIAHNISGALRLTGTLSMSALSSTLEELVRRHETLRANISAPDGKPLQTIRAAGAVAIDVTESSDWRPLYAEEMVRPFDLAHDVLLRAKLIRVAPNEHILLITLHHIAADGWSIGVVMRELTELYAAYAQGRPSPLPGLPIQYGDFARWQRGRMEGRTLEDGLAYWQAQLAELPPVLELTPDRLLHASLAAAERDHEAATSKSLVDKPLRQELEALSRREDTTLFVTLLAAFMVLLMRCTGREDVLIGSPVSGRTRVDTEGLIGLFLNTLALRVKLTREVTFREAVAAVRRVVLDALEHAEVPVERIVQSLDAQRGANVHPLYETIFNFTPSAPRSAELPGLHVRLEDPPALIEEFSTQLFVTDLDGALELDLRYRAKRYGEARMACFLEQYTAILQQVVRDAGVRIGALDLVTPLSRAALPDPAAPLQTPPQTHVVDCIAAWAMRTPDAVGIEHGSESLTYAELARRIDTAAKALRVQRGDVVAVAGPRSIDVVVNMAAVFAAGGVR
jgi:hypothetical protein